jgi:hypothetical protein
MSPPAFVPLSLSLLAALASRVSAQPPPLPTSFVKTPNPLSPPAQTSEQHPSLDQPSASKTRRNRNDQKWAPFPTEHPSNLPDEDLSCLKSWNTFFLYDPTVRAYNGRRRPKTISSRVETKVDTVRSPFYSSTVMEYM